ncbi:hypothetical protein GF345_05220 [Candidatus Woesearchaeota archaeon]|nr:hypothetical protein [Candidatus Woesearchaeota archaeon]
MQKDHDEQPVRHPVSGYDLANMLYAVSQKFSQENPCVSVKFAYLSHVMKTGLNGFSDDVSEMTLDDIKGLGGVCSRLPELVTYAIEAYHMVSETGNGGDACKPNGNGGLVCDRAAELYLTKFFPGIEQKLADRHVNPEHPQSLLSQSQYYPQDY